MNVSELLGVFSWSCISGSVPSVFAIQMVIDVNILRLAHFTDGFSVLCDIGGLLQEVVEGAVNSAIWAGKGSGTVEAVGGDGQVFIHVGDVVHVLVPDFSGWSPTLRTAKGVNAAITNINVEMLVNHACNHDFGRAIAIDVSDHRIFNPGSCRHLSGVDVVWKDGVVACNVALPTGVDDTQVVVVAIDQLHDMVLVEIE